MKKIILIMSVVTSVLFAAVDIHITPETTQLGISGEPKQIPGNVILDLGSDLGNVKIENGSITRFYYYNAAPLHLAVSYCGTRYEMQDSPSKVTVINSNLIEVENQNSIRMLVDTSKTKSSQEWNEGSQFHGKLSCSDGHKVLTQDP